MKIKDYILVADSFGPLPIWSLQHPIKHAKDAFLIPIWKKGFEKIKYIEEANLLIMKLFNPDCVVEAYITGEIEYKKKKDMREIISLQIEKIQIVGI